LRQEACLKPESDANRNPEPRIVAAQLLLKDAAWPRRAITYLRRALRVSWSAEISGCRHPVELIVVSPAAADFGLVHFVP